MVKHKKTITYYIKTTNHIILGILSKKTVWLAFIIIMSKSGVDIEENTETYIKDIGTAVFQILSKII